jgi:hypothetical protein
MRDPKATREQFKAWCTRSLKGLEQERRSADSQKPTYDRTVREKWWAERGSGVYINDEECLEAVVHYVCEGQDQKRER